MVQPKNGISQNWGGLGIGKEKIVHKSRVREVPEESYTGIPTEPRSGQEDRGLQEGLLQENQDRRDAWCDFLKTTIQRKSGLEKNPTKHFLK